MKAIGIPECVEWAETDEITGEFLVDHGLTEENLESLGLESSLHRLKLLVNLKRAESQFHVGDIAMQYPPFKVAEFLSTMNSKYEPYSQSVLKHKFDGEMLYDASDSALKELGIESVVDRAIIKHRFCEIIDGPSALSQKFPPEKVCEVLIAMKFNKSVTFVMTHNIDGGIVAKASDELMKEMGVKTRGQMRKLKSEFI